MITKTDKLLLILKTLWRIPAPFVVPIFLLFAKKTDKVTTHLGQPVVQRYELPPCLSWAETPDEYIGGCGLYEPTVAWIYKRFGWFITSWYWIGLRNVGGSIMWRRGILLGPIYQDLDDYTKEAIDGRADEVRAKHGLTPVKWGFLKLHWELTKDFHGTRSGRPDEDWKTCDYVAKLEIGVW